MTDIARFPHIMLDLETMGTRPGAPIVAIGAVAFDLARGTIGPEFEVRITLQANLDAGLRPEASTIEWWLKQSEDARRQTFEGQRFDLRTALEQLGFWLRRHTENVQVWGNGASFDNALLAEAYVRCGIDTPWHYWNDRCYRTAKNLRPDVLAGKFAGIRHCAIDDARYQAQHLIRLFGGGASEGAAA